MNYIWDWDWLFALSLAMIEASERDVEPGTTVAEVTTRVQNRAREIYKQNKDRSREHQSSSS